MRFWNDMQNKYGFADGEAMPDGIDVFRAVYIRTVNTVAAQLGSTVRAVAYNRSGVHNWCLILFYPLGALEARGISLLMLPVELDVDTVEPDEAMEEAVRQVELMNLDDFVEVKVNITDEFTDFLTHLRPVKDDEPLIVTVGGQPQHCYPEGRAKLVHEVRALNGTLLPSGAEYRLAWLDHYACLAALAEDGGANVAIADVAALVVTEIPAAVRSESANCDPIPPFHLRDLENKPIDAYGTFLNYDDALQGLQRAVHERIEPLRLMNGYGNTVMSLAPDQEG